jgi:D-alanyl-D-alanine dipeptidase
MKTIRCLTVLVFSLGTMTTFAQVGSQTPPPDANTGRPVTDDDIAVLRQDVQADKTEIITRNMNFTEEQAKAFWPVYREYAHEQQKIGDQRVALIKDYAANYDKIDDAQADNYIQRAMKYEEAMASLRKNYIPKFKKAIGAKQTAKFLQVDNRLSLLVNVQLAALLPIIK